MTLMSSAVVNRQQCFPLQTTRKGVNRQQTAWLGLPVCQILKPQLNWKGNGEGCFRPLRFNYLVLDGKKIENKIKARVKKTLKKKTLNLFSEKLMRVTKKQNFAPISVKVIERAGTKKFGPIF